MTINQPAAMDQVEEKPRVSLTERVSFSSVHKTDFDSENANLATDREHEMSLMEAIRAYPWALFWGVILSMALVMESYDMMLMSVRIRSRSLSNVWIE